MVLGDNGNCVKEESYIGFNVFKKSLRKFSIWLGLKEHVYMSKKCKSLRHI